MESISVAGKISPEKERRAPEEATTSARNLPEEVIFDEILPKLPPKSLITFTAVCKSWRSRIRSSDFIRTQLRRAITRSNSHEDGGFQFVKSLDSTETTESYSLSWDDGCSLGEYSELINPFTAIKEMKRTNCTTNYSEYRNINVVGTCNGIVCLCYEEPGAINSSFDRMSALIWNPSVRKLVILPPSLCGRRQTRFPLYAFGFDKKANDYKVFKSIAFYLGAGAFEWDVEIWSLATGSWKRLNADIRAHLYHKTWHSPPFVNGAVHWITDAHLGDGRCIVSLDMSTESFGKIRLPEATERCSGYSLLRYMESLAFAEINDDSGFDLWVMKEYGVANSWEKLLTIARQEMNANVPRAFRNNGELVIGLRTSEWSATGNLHFHQSVDIKTKKSKEIWKAGDRTQFMGSFVESLVLLDQTNAISC